MTLDNEPTGNEETSAGQAGTAAAENDQATEAAAAPRRRTTRRTRATAAAGAPTVSDTLDAAAGEAAAGETGEPAATGDEQLAAPPAKKATRARKRVTSPRPAPRSEVTDAGEAPAAELADTLDSVSAVEEAVEEPAAEPARTRRRRRATSEVTAPTAVDPVDPAVVSPADAEAVDEDEDETPAALGFMPLFQAPEPVRRPRRAATRPAGPPRVADDEDDEVTPARPVADAEEPAEDEVRAAETDEDELDDTDRETEDGTGAAGRRRRRRGGRGRRGRSRGDGDADGDAEGDTEDEAEDADEAAEPVEAEGDAEGDDEGGSSGSRRRRRRRRRGSGGTDADASPDDPPNTVVKVRESRRDDVSGVRGSTRLEAKKQRRREGREAGRRRAVLTEAEFLARRESVERVMIVRERGGRTQIGVLEDGVLVEHYVARKTQTSMVGNVYLGKVQNVLPSMEAAFVDIGKGRNAVLYAGEVNWDAAGLDGQPRRIEHALKAGESVLVQVTKDPIGHKGARLTSQISLPGRYLVFVPDGSMTGISRKLPDTERARLKKILREVVPEDSGVIVRTAAEGAAEEELERDVSRLSAQWEDIKRKSTAVNAPALLYGEPDLAIRVVRDVFNEDFGKLVVSGDDAWDTLEAYIGHVAPDLVPRLERWSGDGDVFAAFRIDEQLAKGLDRKVWLPSGGSLVIDRTEAMTVVDVNTGKFTGAGGNLEETVTKNNLEAAEEVVRQLRLRDIGGIIVVDFIDMVLESNRELVLRRLLECLGRDRTRHQVAEVTSLGLVQMTRKRVGQGLLEVFSETCEHCGGRGVLIHDEPVEKRQQEGNSGGGGGGGGGGGRGGRSRGGRGKDGGGKDGGAKDKDGTKDKDGGAVAAEAAG